MASGSKMKANWATNISAIIVEPHRSGTRAGTTVRGRLPTYHCGERAHLFPSLHKKKSGAGENTILITIKVEAILVHKYLLIGKFINRAKTMFPTDFELSMEAWQGVGQSLRTARHAYHPTLLQVWGLKCSKQSTPWQLVEHLSHLQRQARMVRWRESPVPWDWGSLTCYYCWFYVFDGFYH